MPKNVILKLQNAKISSFWSNSDSVTYQSEALSETPNLIGLSKFVRVVALEATPRVALVGLISTMVRAGKSRNTVTG